MFDILIESNPGIGIQKKIFPLIVSTILHSLVLIVAIIVPLYFTETLNPEKFVTYLVAPPPPPPPPPPPQGGIINPSHRIIRGYPKEAVEKEGKSRMLSFNSTMTVQQLIDLVVFL